VISTAPHAGQDALLATSLAAVPNAAWPWLVSLLCAVASGVLIQRLRTEQRKTKVLSAQIELSQHRRKIVFDFLHDLGEAFAGGIDRDELLRLIADFSVSTTQASAGAVFLLDAEKKFLRAEVVVGPFPPPLQPADVPGTKSGEPLRDLEQILKSQTILFGEGLIGEVAQKGKPVLIQDGLKDARLVHYKDPALQTRTAIFIPLKFRDEVLGVMAVVNKQTGESAPFFNANDLFLLDALADHAAISLHNTTLYTIQAEQKQLDGDLRVASEIQQMLLPDHAPKVPNFELVGHNISARHVGGDYYDFLRLDETHVGVVIADVSGKAIPGALVMTMCRSAIRAQTNLDLSPIDVVRRANELLLPDLREDMFITLLYGILDSTKRTFTFVRAGHDPLLWYHAQTEAVEVVAPHGTAVGLDRSERFGRELEARRLNVAVGDLLVLYTDGITESLNADEAEFGRDQLIELIKQNSGSTVGQICETVFERVREFTNNGPLHDDRTLIVIKAT
jgi:sigma-B regulation protein RsbU (phosphoserine phosphatase)